jgi:predicted acetyltransferase
MELKLVRPDVQYRDSFLAGFRELEIRTEQSSWNYLGDAAALDIPKRDFEEFVRSLLLRETVAAPGFVRDTVYWATLGDEVVGRIAIRHELNEFLAMVGGHVGYIVRPSYRKRGVATEMLRLLLLEPISRNIGRILLTCDESNEGSIKTILKNGGVFDQTLNIGSERARKNHYWITLS